MGAAENPQQIIDPKKRYQAGVLSQMKKLLA